MLDPDPKLRLPIEEVMINPWLKSIDVCHAVPNPTHVHVHARAMIQAQLPHLLQ
jgi:protein-serine/threonine kinase